jgi:hypothetical protein
MSHKNRLETDEKPSNPQGTGQFANSTKTGGGRSLPLPPERGCVADQPQQGVDTARPSNSHAVLVFHVAATDPLRGTQPRSGERSVRLPAGRLQIVSFCLARPLKNSVLIPV